ncbi:YdcF family protein [Acinetobacter silvestris]|uniref:DUF218 domain-containing protein n=1 Tax=Acinetobacter silvestris TaxID=1977882 RepID=A0A1Y3CHJ1_9GAMM|nr:YdcF family protein [Acinetobacter silvestris]OTG65575.1 hypothetical protein B9T28_08955 [Acinetobacter silvestris]
MTKYSILRALLCILGLILFLDGLLLILQKKIHLGTLLPFTIGLFFLIYSVFFNKINAFIAQHPKLKKIWKIGWMLFITWLLSLAVFFIYLTQYNQSINPNSKVAVIIVLGSGIIQGKASPTLAARLDSAAQIALQQPQAIIIVSGGLDYAETKTEADIMAQYLTENYHIPTTRILKEDQSTSTALNLENSAKILVQHQINKNAPIAIVTSDFHTLRAAAIARKQGYHDFITVNAPTPLATRYNAWLREYFAYISGAILGEY